MTKNHKILIGGLLALLAILCIWTVTTIPDAPQEAPEEGPRVMTYTGNTISAEQDGKILWELTAETMEVDVDTQDMVITNMDGKFYTEDGRTLQLKAPKANYSEKQKFLTAEGGIVGDSTDGMHVRSEKLEWNGAENLLALIGKAEVRRDTDALLAQGDRIESADSFNLFKIIGHAHLEKGNK